MEEATIPHLSESFGISGPLALTTTKQTGVLSREAGCKLTRPLFILLIICLFCSAAVGQPWDGNGVEGDPYLIYTPAQMNTIGAMLLDYDKHFRLMANIDLSAYTGTSFFIIGSSAFPFTGVFDGNGHTISNFTYSSTGTNHIGLFGYVDGPDAEIKDLRLIDPNVDAGTGDYVGSLVGWLQNGTITNCYAEAVSVSGRLNVGGLLGRNQMGGTITNCHSSGSVSAGAYVGGLVGGNEGTITNCNSSCNVSSGVDIGVGGLVGNNIGTISNCYYTGSVSGVIYVGGLVGVNIGTIFNCYSTASVSGTGSAIGGLVGLNSSGGDVVGEIYNCYATGSVSGGNTVGGLVGFNAATVTNCYSTGSVSGTTDVGGLLGLNNGMVSASFWDIQTSGRINMCGGGSGSGCDDGNGKTTAQMQDINTFLAAGWDFVGEYGPSDDWAEPNVGGYMILWWQLPENELPALPTFSGGTGEANDPYLISTTTDLNRIGHNGRLMAAHFRLINNIDLAGVDFFLIGSRGYGYSGVFDGNGHIISNFTYSSTGTNNIGLFGGVAGEDAEVKDLRLIDPNVDAGTGDYIGSLVGWLADASISGCYVDSGSVSGGSVQLTGGVGGLVGYNGYGLITNCYSTASISGNYEVGGLVGRNYYGTISNCYSTGNIQGHSRVGGLVGRNYYGTISNCNSSGDVSGVGGSVGGLAGYNRGGTVSNCYATGSVSGHGSVGGLVGGTFGTITNCYATGSVSGDENVGGLVGGSGDRNSSSTITNCYSSGSVSGGSRLGGLLGRNMFGGTITNCYSAGSVTGTTEVGGLMGTNESGTISASFWDIQTSGRSNMCGGGSGSGCDDGYGRTTVEMKDPNTFISAGWDFFGESSNGTEDIWRLCSAGTNYPKLTWQFPLSDFVCPDGVDWSDLGLLCDQWLLELIPADVGPNGGDGFVNFLDWAIFADGWQITNDIFDLADFADQWLKTGANYLIADIAPPADGDGIVNMLDFAALANNWLAGM